MKIVLLNIIILFSFCSIYPQVSKIEEKFITLAAQGDSAKLVRLIDKGINIDARNKARWTALAYACKYGHLGVVKLLIENNVDINLCVNTGSTPLLVAINNSNYDISEYLIEHNANVNIKDLTGMSPLAWMAKRGDLKRVKYLVENGADVNSKNVNSRTVLDNTNSVEIIKYLRNKGAKTGKELSGINH